MGAATLIIGITMFCTSLLMPGPRPSHAFKNADTLAWSPTNRLTWSDFKTPDSKDTLDIARAAVTLSYYVYRPDPFGKTSEVDVVTCVNRNASKYNPELRTEAVLEREQIHFDIMELHARKMRRAVEEAGLPVLGANRKAEKLFTPIYKDAEKMCARFDTETDEGANAIARAKWETTLRRELNELGNYARQIPPEE